MNELTNFVYIYLAEHLPIATPKFHFELHDLIFDKRVAIAAPRSFAKSYTYSFFYPLYLVMTKPNQNILLISATATLAENWLRRIKREIEENEKLISMYGKQTSDKWTDSWICLANGNQIRAAGSGCQVRGFRYTTIVCDDLDTDEGVRSEDQREKLNSWFWASLLNTLEPESQLIVIGTILHPFSFLAELMKGRDGWVTRKYKAISDEGKLLWSAKWPLDKLNKRRAEIGSIAFASEFLNTPVQEISCLFKRADIQTYKDGEEKDGQVWITVDLAISEKESADYTVILVASRSEDNRIYVLDYVCKRILPAETIKYIIELAEEYRPVAIGIETVGYQKALMFGLKEEMRRRGRLWRVDEIRPDKDKYRRIGGLVPYVEGHYVYLHENMTELMQQMVLYPNVKHDDLCDALAMQLVINRPRYEEDIVTIPIWGDEGKRRVGAY